VLIATNGNGCASASANANIHGRSALGSVVIRMLTLPNWSRRLDSQLCQSRRNFAALVHDGLLGSTACSAVEIWFQDGTVRPAPKRFERSISAGIALPTPVRQGTAITEGTANFLVNRRMNKSQQMRWSRRGADLLLQVRCAVYNGTLGSGFGQKFQPANETYSPMAIAA